MLESNCDKRMVPFKHSSNNADNSTTINDDVELHDLASLVKSYYSKHEQISPAIDHQQSSQEEVNTPVIVDIIDPSPGTCSTPLQSIKSNSSHTVTSSLTSLSVSTLPSVDSVEPIINMIKTKEGSKSEVTQLIQVSSSHEEDTSDNEVTPHCHKKLLINKKNIDDEIELASLSSAEETNSLNMANIGIDTYNYEETDTNVDCSVETDKASSMYHQSAAEYNIQTERISVYTPQLPVSLNQDTYSIDTKSRPDSDVDVESLTPQQQQRKTSDASCERDDVESENLLASNQEDLNTEDADKVSVFEGSLKMDVAYGVWSTEIFDQMKIELGRDEWETKFPEIVGNASKENWPSSFNDIEESKETAEEWSTSISEIASNEVTKDEWSTSIAEVFENKEVPANWNTRFNKIKKVSPEENKWTTVFKNMIKRTSNNSEWTTTFKTIASNKNAKRNSWTTSIPDKLTCVSHKQDWSTKINKIDRKTVNDQWTYEDRDLLVTSADRETHWSSTFKGIAENDENKEQWSTKFNKIAPNPDKDGSSWSVAFKDLENNCSNSEDWSVKFIDIEPVLKEANRWSVSMNDIPNSYREPNDWDSKFNSIEPVNKDLNPWNTFFKDINRNGDESHWSNIFLETDISDMSRDTWQSHFNEIIPNENTISDWNVSLNPIETSSG